MVPVSRSGRPYGTIVVTSARPLTDAEHEYLEFVAVPTSHHLVGASCGRGTSETSSDQRRDPVCGSGVAGLTSETIARRTAYSVETVNSYLKSATKKVGVSNRTEAVAEAVRRRLIS